MATLPAEATITILPDVAGTPLTMLPTCTTWAAGTNYSQWSNLLRTTCFAARSSTHHSCSGSYCDNDSTHGRTGSSSSSSAGGTPPPPRPIVLPRTSELHVATSTSISTSTVRCSIIISLLITTTGTSASTTSVSTYFYLVGIDFLASISE